MALGKTTAKDVKAAKEAETAKQKETPTPSGPSEDDAKKGESPQPKAAQHREVSSLHPSEMKAILLVGGKKVKAVYQMKKGVGMISLPNLGFSVPLQDWLDGKVDIKGL